MSTTTCPACGQPIAPDAPTTKWEGQTVHRVCPDVDYSCLSTNPYHAHIFWNEAVPGGLYTRDPIIPWDEVVAAASAYRLHVERGPDPEFTVF